MIAQGECHNYTSFCGGNYLHKMDEFVKKISNMKLLFLSICILTYRRENHPQSDRRLMEDDAIGYLVRTVRVAAPVGLSRSAYQSSDTPHF